MELTPKKRYITFELPTELEDNDLELVLTTLHECGAKHIKYGPVK